MSIRQSGKLLWKAIGISVCLNSVMIVTGVLADVAKPLAWLGWISTAIAAPPGLIIRLFIHLGGQSARAYIAEAVAAFLCSIAFYTIIALLVMLVIVYRESSRLKAS